MTSVQDRVVVVGLGAMGGQLARRLAEQGHDVIGIDPDAAARDGLTDDPLPRPSAGGRLEAVSAFDASQAHCVGVVVVSLPDDEVVTSTLIGVDGLVGRLQPGTVIVETSTISPAAVRQVAEEAAACGVLVVDAPVSGGPMEASSGNLLIFAASTPEARNRAYGVLTDLGSVHPLGTVGEGKVLKLVNNFMGLANLAAAAEAFTLGVQAGVDPQVLYDTLSVSGGRSHHFTKRFQYVLEDDYTARWSMAIGEKDLRTALAMADDLGMATPLGTHVSRLYRTALDRGLSEEDVVAIVKLFEPETDPEGT